MTTPEGAGERVLVLAPLGRDAELASATLARAAIAALVCGDIEALCRELASGAGALLLTQEALSPWAVDRLLTALAGQPPWADLPLVVLVSGGAAVPATARLVAALAAGVPATFLERPVRATTLVGAVQAALRARRRQYELRDLLLAREQAEEAERQARAAAELAVRTRDGLMAAVAHDLKNPLAAAKGYAQLLRRRAARLEVPEAARLAEGLAEIDATIGRAVDQLDELLDLARLQTDQPLRLDRAPTDLVALARALAGEYDRASEGCRVRVETCVNELIGVWDRRRLERALGNLLANAVKYSPGGGEVVVAVGRELAAAGPCAVVAVRDRGIGIPATDLPYLFERFYRASNADGRITGTGLGLAGTRQIVEQHGGTLTVESVEGEGSTFTVRLPLAPATAGAPIEAAAG